MRELEGLKLVVVDDEGDILDIMAFYLESKGAKVFVASSGTEAYEIAVKERPDFILTDIIMPGAGNDGLTLTRRLREHSPTAPKIIVITGLSQETEAEALAAGADKVFAKPFKLPLVLKYITETRIS